jgi:DNA-binding response OmpR family regulator
MLHQTNLKIFIAEDDEAILELLKIRLKAANYDTAHASDGVKAVAEISKTAPDAIILDIGLPNLDGFGVLAAVRCNPRFWKTPVVMLTARHASADVKRAIDAGAQDYLAKPFEVGELLVRLTRLLRGRVRAVRD